ncbi:MAG: glycosyltransferase [Acholeplasmataceae bacterium]
MIIVYVIDNYGEFSNGTTITALRSKLKLEALGHSVRIVTAGDYPGKDIYHLKKRNIPIVSKASEKQHMFFAKYDEKVMREAFEGADVVHFFMPWDVSVKGVRLCKKMNIPYTAAFHSQPESITYGMGLGRLGKPIAWLIYKKHQFKLYRKVLHVHCPTQFIAKELKRHHYHNQTHVISNGIDQIYQRGDKTEKDYFQILSTGRYALEKRQDIIIKAISRSKYKHKIKLVLAGQGPLKEKYERIAKTYDVDTTFGFFDQQTLLNIMHQSDLYVHAADAEIEGIAALEAVACGLVPVIAKAKKSATSQFALDERSLFEANDYKTLALKIDYWFDHLEEKEQMSKQYELYAQNYRLDHSVELLEQMFKQAIEDKQKLEAYDMIEKKYKKLVVKSRTQRFLSAIVYYGIAVPILSIYLYLFQGVRIKNRKNIRGIEGGAIMISNHVHTLDSVMSAISAFPKKPIFTGIKDNFELPIAGKFVSILGTTPIPETPNEIKVFFHQLSKQIRKGRIVHFFPEGELVQKDSQLRAFKKGAFLLAEETKSPIIPVGIQFREPTNSLPFFGKSKIIVSIGKPIYPDLFMIKKESINQLKNASFEEMNELIESK